MHVEFRSTTQNNDQNSVTQYKETITCLPYILPSVNIDGREE